MLILAGLGNPGPKYEGNRHNIGFMAVDAIADRWSFGPERSRFQGRVREGEVPTPAGPVKALALKPQTFMNESGRSVGDALAFYKAKPSELVVFHDELDIAPGRFRMKLGGGAAGHNGLRSISARLGPDYRRARLGIGHPGHKDLVLNWVLADFHKVDQPWLKALCEACADAAPLLAAGEDEKYQTEVARLAPAEKLDTRAANRERLGR
jgi:peptidyl-tRNA hydrolase, PTH1 family